jgi:uncharacterized repeat protein (TIGR03803 family)
LIADASGNLFGTTAAGGAYGYGTVFEIAKTASGYASNPTTLVSFDSASGGSSGPNGGLVFDADGNLFGTTAVGGMNDEGTVFEIAKTSTGYASDPITLVSFGYDYINGVDPGFGYTNGTRPNGGLIIDSSGNLFGTTRNGGATGYGTVFEVVKTATGYSSSPPTLVSFDQADAGLPNGGLVADANGNLFGMTTESNPGGSGGTLFEIVNTATGYASTATTLVGFDAATYPESSLIADASGTLYGVSRYGGFNGWGEAFQIIGSGFAVNDTVDYSSDAQSGGTEGVFVDLANEGAKDGFGAFQTLISIANVRGTGSPYPDGSGVGDILLGSASDNLFQGLAGADHIDGRGGSDTADYSADARFGGNIGIYADLGNGSVVDGFGNTDILVAIENIIGTDSPSPSFAGHSDVIHGSDDANRIDARGGDDVVVARGGDDIVLGGLGHDYLSGEGGNDTIIGGEGNDIMIGGDGGDTFQVDLASLISGQRDAINDFLPGADSILFPLSTQGQLVFGDGYIGCGTDPGQFYALMVPGATAAQLQTETSFA